MQAATRPTTPSPFTDRLHDGLHHHHPHHHRATRVRFLPTWADGRMCMHSRRLRDKDSARRQNSSGGRQPSLASAQTLVASSQSLGRRLRRSPPLGLPPRPEEPGRSRRTTDSRLACLADISCVRRLQQACSHASSGVCLHGRGAHADPRVGGGGLCV